MPENNELANMLRAVIQEEMQSVRQEVRSIVKEELQPVNDRLTALEAGQQGINDRLTTLEAGQRALEAGQKKIETKVEEIRATNRKSHLEIVKRLDALRDDFKIIERRVELQEEKAVR